MSDYDLAPDDQRLLAVRSTASEAQERVILVENWAEELRERAGN